MIYVDSSNDDLQILPLDGGDQEPFMASPAANYGARFSPDGRWVLYGTDESGRFTAVLLPVSIERVPTSKLKSEFG